MSKSETYLENPIIVISKINDSILVQGKKYKVVSLYNHSNGTQYYVLQNMGHLFCKEWFSVVESADNKLEEEN